MTDALDMVKAVLATTAPRWLNMTKTLPVDLLNRQPAAGEWSATECLIHLLDVEHIFPFRVQAILAGQAIPAFDPDTQGTKNTASSPEQRPTNLPAYARPASPCWSASPPRTSTVPLSIVSLEQ